MSKWGALVVLGLAQFLMVLDQAVMNVAISQLVEDFDTTVTTIQGVITLYALVMATLMVTGGKLGDIMGRRRAFVIGLVMFVLPLLLGWVYPYVAELRDGLPRTPITLAVIGDLVLLASLFVLGGEFWDKIRSLFVREATARFPPAATVERA